MKRPRTTQRAKPKALFKSNWLSPLFDILYRLIHTDLKSRKITYIFFIRKGAKRLTLGFLRKRCIFVNDIDKPLFIPDAVEAFYLADIA